VLADAPPRVGRLVQLGRATADRRPRRLGQPRDPADPAIAQRPGRRAEQQPTLPLGQMRRDQREGRRQHLIQIHWMNLTSPAQPGKVTERGPLIRFQIDGWMTRRVGIALFKWISLIVAYSSLYVVFWQIFWQVPPGEQSGRLFVLVGVTGFEPVASAV
jgi:hypothetical protein